MITIYKAGDRYFLITLYYEHHFISTVSLRHVSALKRPFSGRITDTQQPGQQNALPDVKYSFRAVKVKVNVMCMT
jgi:hypothetical protein